MSFGRGAGLTKRDQELEGRIEHLESALAHQQHEYDMLNQVVIDQAARLDKLELLLQRTNSQLHDSIHSLHSTKIDPLDEKPPHY